MKDGVEVLVCVFRVLKLIEKACLMEPKCIFVVNRYCIWRGESTMVVVLLTPQQNSCMSSEEDVDHPAFQAQHRQYNLRSYFSKKSANACPSSSQHIFQPVSRTQHGQEDNAGERKEDLPPSCLSLAKGAARPMRIGECRTHVLKVSSEEAMDLNCMLHSAAVPSRSMLMREIDIFFFIF
jgi:hypothetical protein